MRVLLAPGLTAEERSWVGDYLDLERAAFFAQPRVDQRHGYEAARRVGPRADLVRAALLHDIGKRHSRLSPVERALVTAAAKLRLPIGRRGELYVDHGRLAAAELALWEAEPLVIAFAAHHHADRPDTVPAEDWDALSRADH